MASAPAQRPVDLATLVKLGAYDIRTWAIEFKPKPTARGINSETKPVSWKCTITSLDVSRPTVFSIKPTAEEAESSAKALYVEMMSRRPPKAAAPPPAPADDADDDDVSNLI